MAVELGNEGEAKASTFCLNDEDHTLGNSLRFVLNRDPRVAYCGYSVPHPSMPRVNVRVQTTGAPAKEVFKDALQDLIQLCGHVNTTFESCVENFKTNVHSDTTTREVSGMTDKAM